MAVQARAVPYSIVQCLLTKNDVPLCLMWCLHINSCGHQLHTSKPPVTTCSVPVWPAVSPACHAPTPNIKTHAPTCPNRTLSSSPCWAAAAAPAHDAAAASRCAPPLHQPLRCTMSPTSHSRSPPATRPPTPASCSPPPPLLCLTPPTPPQPQLSCPAHPCWHQQWAGCLELVVQHWLHQVLARPLAGVAGALVRANGIVRVHSTTACMMVAAAVQTDKQAIKQQL
jgi:hypothetical protein